MYAVATKTKNNALMNPVIVSSCFFALSITAGITVKASAIYTIANTVVTIFDSFLFFGNLEGLFVFWEFGGLKRPVSGFPIDTLPTYRTYVLLSFIYTSNPYFAYRYMR